METKKTIKENQNKSNNPSKQIETVSNWWRSGLAIQSQLNSLDEIRDYGENWASLTAEPRSVDYIETEAGSVLSMWAIPKGCVTDRVLLCLHGGGFFSGSMYTHRKLFGHLAKGIGCQALIVNYRLSPEHKHPAQVDDSLASYRWLLDQGIKSQHIALTGDSAGGGLAITTLLKARDQGLPMAAASMCMSPWFDMELTAEKPNTEKDLLSRKGIVQGLIKMFLEENGDPRDPYANPLYADLRGLPPVYIHVGGDETLLYDSLQFVERAKKAGVQISLDVFPNMQHTFQMAAGRAPESDGSISRFVEWVKPKLGLI